MMNVPYSSPDVSLPRDGGEMLNLNELRPKNVVLFFYPRDATPSCTKEAIAFSQAKEDFEKLNTVIIGISKDSIKKHKNFIKKQGLKIKLASDEEGNVIESFGVWVEKKMYGRTYMGIERSTFIISSEKKILEIYKKVKVKNHANLVLERAKELI